MPTGNLSKVEQIKAVFAGSSIEIMTMGEARIVGDAIEDGNTLAENAQKKAEFVFDQLSEKLPVMADDTGLFIEALDDAPGVKSSRWAGEDATTEEIMHYTLKRLEGEENRKAFFATVAALIMPDGQKQIFSGKATGVILEAPRVPFQPKMPYSGIFLSDEVGKVWAEMSVEEENKVSHRGKAFRQVREYLERLATV